MIQKLLDGLRNPWVIVGFTGQLVYSMRFIVQWIASERAKRSVIPVSFWWISLGGSALLLTYAVYKADPVFILGQAFGFIIYIRNLHLLSKRQPEAAA
jgi:lipid-A-disaccharide synthase-like uncharacterized protein